VGLPAFHLTLAPAESSYFKIESLDPQYNPLPLEGRAI
jgi:hypothetical protein